MRCVRDSSLCHAGGTDLYLHWLDKVRDPKARIAILRRVNRVEAGNFGDHKFCRDGVWELRIDAGAGYRIYYAISGSSIVLLLCGGDKATQTADINRACDYWNREKGAFAYANKKS